MARLNSSLPANAKCLAMMSTTSDGWERPGKGIQREPIRVCLTYEYQPRSFSSFLPQPVLCICSEMLVTMVSGCRGSAPPDRPNCCTGRICNRVNTHDTRAVRVTHKRSQQDPHVSGQVDHPSRRFLDSLVSEHSLWNLNQRLLLRLEIS